MDITHARSNQSVTMDKEEIHGDGLTIDVD